MIICLQPLTEFANTTKCKRCGFYEADFLKSDEFDEWELCPSDFSNADGRYNHFKEKELNATFLCLECMPLESSGEGCFPTDLFSNHILFSLPTVNSEAALQN